MSLGTCDTATDPSHWARGTLWSQEDLWSENSCHAPWQSSSLGRGCGRGRGWMDGHSHTPAPLATWSWPEGGTSTRRQHGLQEARSRTA